MDLTRFISEQLNATNIDDSVVPLWKEKIDVDSLLRMIALEIVISNSDAYLTMANNYILYDDYESDRVAFSAQDFDLTMGSAINNAGFSTRPLTSSLIRVPKFKQDLERLIYRMTKDLVNTKLLAPRIESLRDFLLEDVVWDQNLPRLGKGLRRPGHNNDNDSKMEPETAFLAAIHGPTNSTRSMALLDWIEFRSNNILDFFERLK
ncbi:hypothetical protein CU098_009935 [Rhizopus stolonifer]|uniref:Uncharacterized protein n=2 Tax=Mucorineae TaxID=1344963 RepID=A0A367JG42_RHIST|nr:hypothetical protein CU098_009935 [Rhizopus stolonifer]